MSESNLKDMDMGLPYDCIVTCWGLGYIQNSDLIPLLIKANASLQPFDGREKPGIMIVKETV